MKKQKLIVSYEAVSENLYSYQLSKNGLRVYNRTHPPRDKNLNNYKLK